MKRVFVLILNIIMLLALVACGKTVDGNISQNEPNKLSSTSKIETTPDSESGTENDSSDKQNANSENSMTNISITVGSSVFSAKLYDNDAANALLAQFPMTLNMSDMNGNEKYYYFTDDLPFKSTEKPATINAGDIMCWSGNSLVLFYKTFSNSYAGYVRLGYVEDISGLTTALGSGNVQITFAVSG